MVMIGVV